MTSYVGNASANMYPDRAVCEVFAHFTDGTWEQGTGVFVSANDVLTASHMLWQVDHGGEADRVTVIPGANGSYQPYGQFEAAHWYNYQVADGNDQITRQQSQYDVGIVSLGTREGDVVGWFGMDSNAHSGDYNLTGYPAKYGPNLMTNDFGHANTDGTYRVFDYTSIETNPGNSGGPLWYMGANGPMCVGIASSSV